MARGMLAPESQLPAQTVDGQGPTSGTEPQEPSVITHLNIKNFKAWRDSGDIRLAPLTLLFGANSAGKTSIPHLLLMLRQTLESTDRKRVLHLGDQGTLVDLGTYEDIVFRHELDRTLEFEIGWETVDAVEIRDPLQRRFHRSASTMKFAAAIKADRNRQPSSTTSSTHWQTPKTRSLQE